MASKRVWVIRVGVGAEIIGYVRRKHVVAVGWARMGDCSGLQTRDEFRERSLSAADGEAFGRSDYGQMFRFVREIQIGDTALVPDRGRGEALVGEITSAYRFDTSALNDKYPHVRDVEWRGEQELETLLAGPTVEEIAAQEDVAEGSDFLQRTRAAAHELIVDRLRALDWPEFDALARAVLRVVGLPTRQAASDGPHRLLTAHPDALGFEEPRVDVVVRHRHDPVAGGEVRSFRDEISPHGKGLMISRAGFTAEALREPEAGGPPVVLVDLDEFIRLLIENYEALEPEAQELLPLGRVYIPRR
jgi:restriction system protein